MGLQPEGPGRQGIIRADTAPAGFTAGRGLFRGSNAQAGRFTALDPLREKGGDPDFYGYCVDDPVNRVDVWGLAGERADVMFCKRPLDDRRLQDVFDHHWLKTPTTESGLGKYREDGSLFSRSRWEDHAGQSGRPDASCWPVPEVDAGCVDKLIRPGNEIGVYFPGTNDCQTSVRDVLDYCRTDVKE